MWTDSRGDDGDSLTKEARSDAEAAAATTPLPRAALVVVFLIQISEAMNATVLFPFVVFMLRDFGVSERRLGALSGVVGATFFAGQVLSSYHWGRLADSVGCKRCLVLGSLGTALASGCFALSRSAGAAIGARLLCGLINGNIGVMKSFLTHATDETNRPAAFAVMPLGFGLGIVAAAEIGGALSRPADRWPAVFGAFFWRRYKYALPLLVCAGFQLLTALFAQIVIADGGERTESYAAVDAGDGAAEPAPLRPVWRQRKPLLSCAAYAFMASAQILFDELFPLYARGCLGWRPASIGAFLSYSGLSVFVGALLSPRLIRRTSTMTMFFVCNGLSLPLGLALPLFRTRGSLFAVYFATRLVQTTAFTSVMLLVNSSAPSREIGAVNGMGQSMAAFARAAGGGPAH